MPGPASSCVADGTGFNWVLRPFGAVGLALFAGEFMRPSLPSIFVDGHFLDGDAFVPDLHFLPWMLEGYKTRNTMLLADKKRFCVKE